MGHFSDSLSQRRLTHARSRSAGAKLQREDPGLDHEARTTGLPAAGGYTPWHILLQTGRKHPA